MLSTYFSEGFSIAGLLRERKDLSQSVSGVLACFDGIENGINELRRNFMVFAIF